MHKRPNRPTLRPTRLRAPRPRTPAIGSAGASSLDARLGLLLVVLAVVVAACAAPEPSVRDDAPPDAPIIGGAPELSPDEDAGVTDHDRAFAKAMVAAAEKKIASGDPAGALPLLEDAVARDPLHAGAWLLLARTGEGLGAPADVVRDRYARARALAPDDPAVHRLAASFAEGQGDKAAAREGYARALALKPDDVDALVRLGSLELESGDAKSAAQRFSAALAIDETSVAAQVGLAEAAERAGDLQTAEQANLALIQRFPEVSLYRSRLAAFYRRHGRDAEANRVEAELQKRDPKDRRKLRELRSRKKGR